MTVVGGGPPVARAVMRRDGASILPPPGISTFGAPGPYVYDAPTARKVPAVGRALQLYTGLTKQMALGVFRGETELPTPRIAQRPDPANARSWFVHVNVEDYMLNGNAVSLVTSRGVDGWPLSVAWLPSQWVYITWDVWGNVDEGIRYNYLGTRLPTEDVIHVKRGADRAFPVRGIGVVEEYLSTFDRAALEEAYEKGALDGGAVPSVAVITPHATITPEVADDAKDAWLNKFAGPAREPAILPAGTQVIPLAWSPTDTQLTEARRMSLIDVANAWNLDSYWLGAPVSGLTYKSAAPQYQQILRTSLEGVLVDFEDVWSDAWLPRGTGVRFDRSTLLVEDLSTATTAAVAAYNAGLISQQEGRRWMREPADIQGDAKPEPVAPPAPPQLAAVPNEEVPA